MASFIKGQSVGQNVEVDRQDNLQSQLNQCRHRLVASDQRLINLGQHCQMLLTQLRGGHKDSDPHADESHPGHALIRLGWTFVGEDPDEPEPELPIWYCEKDGCYWRDPEERGTGKTSLMPLTMALGIVCRRLLGLRVQDGSGKTRSERLINE